jgi:hypothetical protein
MRKAKNYCMVKNERNIMHAVERRKASEISHVLRRNCLLEDAIERKNRNGKTRMKT